MGKASVGTEVLVVLAAFLAVAFLPTAQAKADDFGFPSPPAPGYFGAGADYYFYFDGSVPGVDRYRYNEAMEFLDDATDIFDVPTSTLGSGTDIVFIHASGPIDGNPAIRGKAVCARWANALICDQYWILVYIPTIFAEATDGTNFQINFDKTIRHEIGHTTGLRHSAGAGPYLPGSPGSYQAMISGSVSSSLYWYAYNTSDHIPHINGLY